MFYVTPLHVGTAAWLYYGKHHALYIKYLCMWRNVAGSDIRRYVGREKKCLFILQTCMLVGKVKSSWPLKTIASDLLTTAVVWKILSHVPISLSRQATFMLPLRYSINKLHWHTPKFIIWEYLCFRCHSCMSPAGQCCLTEWHIINRVLHKPY